MSETDITLSVLKRSREMLQERGWTYRFSSGKNSSLNIRSAISASCHELAPNAGDWYVAYRSSVATLVLFLKDGIQSWEFGTHASRPRMRQEHEVMEMLDKVIKRLESREEKACARISSGNSSGTL